jgi:single-stranded-DNA-specific exonuclease
MRIHQMDVAVARLRQAVENQERVRVVTDYDVDGTTSSLILQSTLRLLGLRDISYHIPDRKGEGYGFSIVAAETAAADGIHLIVTADIGVKDHASVTRARTLGVDVIICDHHLPPDTDVPADATAVLCPPQADCNYPNQALAACGVSLKLAQALLADHPRSAAILRSQLKLAAIGTVADVVDLSTPENRAIVSLGLDSLNRDRHAPGLTALIEAAGLEPGSIRCSDLGFRLGPRINAAGRMASATDVVELLTTRDPAKARELAQRLEQLNSERKRVQDRLVRTASEQLGSEPPPFIVVGGNEDDGWHRGVVGIVAARLRDRHHRPAAVIAIQGDQATGSVRSTPQVHAVQALQGAADLLTRFGGHPAAAGFSLPTVNLAALKERLSEQALQLTGGQVPAPEHIVDARVTADRLNHELVRALAALAPHGKGNPAPQLLIRGTLGETRVLKDTHLKARLEGTLQPVDLIWWSAAQDHGDRWKRGTRIEVLGTLSVNVWRGRETLQVTVRDARQAN